MSAPLVFLPGWCLGRGPLSFAVNALNGSIFDLPGYRDAPLITDFDAAVDDIAARHPAKVSKLVLVAGTASFVQRDGWPHAMPPEMLAEFTTGILADVETMLPRFVGGFNRGDARSKEVTRTLLDLADPRPPTATLAAGLNWLRDVDLRNELSRIMAPCLFIHGSADPLMPRATADALASQISGAELAVFEDCAHAPFISRPDDFLARIRNFLHD